MVCDTHPFGAGQAGPGSPRIHGFVSCSTRFHAWKNCCKPCKARLTEGGLRPSLFSASLKKRDGRVETETVELEIRQATVLLHQS